MEIPFPFGSFGNDKIEDIKGRLMLGWVRFHYKKADGSLRHAWGTRDLGADGVDFDLLPESAYRVRYDKNGNELITYIDKLDGAPRWRCFSSARFGDIDDDIVEMSDL